MEPFVACCRFFQVQQIYIYSIFAEIITLIAASAVLLLLLVLSRCHA
jgi:hypothetical protein